MTADQARLRTPFSEGTLTLAPLGEEHRAALGAACAADPDIWHIYPVDYGPERFDANFSALLANAARMPLAVIVDGVVSGMTAYLRIDAGAQTLEIGNSYITPALRGSGLNGQMKRLMIDHAFACGFRRIEFRVDVRNERSQGAVRKLGAVHEGTLRAERITWTGHVRDTMLFGLLAEDWAKTRA